MTPTTNFTTRMTVSTMPHSSASDVRQGRPTQGAPDTSSSSPSDPKTSGDVVGNIVDVTTLDVVVAAKIVTMTERRGLMDRARIVVVTGAPGSGKSTLGAELASTLRIPFVARDDVRGGSPVA